MADNSNLLSAVLLKTDPGLYAAVDGGNSWQGRVKTRGARVAKYRRYERGDHDASMTDQMRRVLNVEVDDARLTAMNDNYCKIIVDKMASRIAISEITTEDEATQEWIDETAERNEMETVMQSAIRGAIRDGDSYIMADNRTLQWVAEPAYDGFSGVFAIFDAMGRFPVWACKLWSEADSEDIASSDDSAQSSVSMKIVVLQPDRVSFWKGEEGGADVTFISEEAWPVDKVRVPVIHYVDQRDNYTPYGESELRVAMPLQDILNRLMYSMAMASSNSAFPSYWAKGVELSRDGVVPGSIHNAAPFDDISQLTPEMSAWLSAIEFGQFEATDMSNYTIQVDTLVREISQASQTPIYGVTAQGNLSGEALKQLEIGLIGKVKRFQRENTTAVRDLIMLAAEMQNAFGPGSAPEIKSISVNWKSPEIVDTGAQVAVLYTMREKAPGLWGDEWYREQIGALLGMTQKQITEEGDNAQNAQSLSIDRLIGADGGIPPVVGGEDTPENIESAEGLNGAQITAALSIMNQVAEGVLARGAGLELLVSVGIGREIANKMLDEQESINLPSDLIGADGGSV